MINLFNKSKLLLRILSLIICILILFSCKKSSFLDESPNQQLIIPKSVNDFQAILDDYYTINTRVPNLTEVSSDNYYWLPGYINSANTEVLNAYIWNDDIWYKNILLNWSYPYHVVFNSNVVLDGLEDITPSISETDHYNSIKGTALFLRSFCFSQLLQLFSPLYSESLENYGIPLRLKADINERIYRSTIKESYDKVISDLKSASLLLPSRQNIKTRPSKSAANALLARTYLFMNMIDSSLKYANICLSDRSELMDYNSDPITQFNIEVLWPATMQSSDLPIYGYATTSVDSFLISEYDDNDLRKTVFYDINPLGGYYFKGSYDGSAELFAGLAIDEVYLIKAECLARLDLVPEAVELMNKLIQKRWNNNGTWIPFSANSSEEALQIILKERRKELAFRGLRWADLRRLNEHGANIILKRVLDDGETFELDAKSSKYVFLIPPAVINFNPEMLQNKR